MAIYDTLHYLQLSHHGVQKLPLEQLHWYHRKALQAKTHITLTNLATKELLSGS